MAGHKKATARVAALEAAVKLMKANIEEIKATIVTMHLYAPFDGTVVEKQGEEGEIITPTAMSSSLGRTAVVTIADLEKMDVETDISENLLWRIALGQPAEVSVSAIPSKRYRGRLRQVMPMSDRTRGTVKVKVEILDPDDKLFPELAATVHFLPEQDRRTARTPAGRSCSCPSRPSSRRTATTTSGSSATKNVVRKRPVEVATTTDDLARVESGLEAGRVGRPEPDQGPARKRDRADRRVTARRVPPTERFIVHGRDALDRACAASTRNIAATSSAFRCWSNLDLAVDEGEFLALMGPSGSGKTTLLNLIAGLDRATRGEVIVHGQDLGELSEAEITRWRANNVGFIFQTYNLIPVLTAFENVELPLLLTHLSRRKRRENVMTALRIVGLDGPRASLSAPALRRPGAARGHRAGDRHRPLPAGRRRADRRPRPRHRPARSSTCSSSSIASSRRRSSWSRTTRWPPSAPRRTLHLDKGQLVDDVVQESRVSAAS